MFETKDAGTVRRLENAITQLRGVRRARVVSGDNSIETVRVLVIPERATAETIRRVQAVILRETGLSLPGESIQVLRTGQTEPGSPQRRRLSSISTERTADRFKARVVLELCGDTLVGESDSPNERTSEFRSVARATLHGLDELLPCSVDLASVDVFDNGAHQTAIVAVSHPQGSMVGSALVRVDHHDAIARATLDAINRYVDPQRAPADAT